MKALIKGFYKGFNKGFYKGFGEGLDGEGFDEFRVEQSSRAINGCIR